MEVLAAVAEHEAVHERLRHPARRGRSTSCVFVMRPPSRVWIHCSSASRPISRALVRVVVDVAAPVLERSEDQPRRPRPGTPRCRRDGTRRRRRSPTAAPRSPWPARTVPSDHDRARRREAPAPSIHWKMRIGMLQLDAVRHGTRTRRRTAARFRSPCTSPRPPRAVVPARRAHAAPCSRTARSIEHAITSALASEAGTRSNTSSRRAGRSAPPFAVRLQSNADPGRQPRLAEHPAPVRRRGRA